MNVKNESKVISDSCGSFLSAALPCLHSSRGTLRQRFTRFICHSETKTCWELQPRWMNTLIIYPRLSYNHMGTQATIYTHTHVNKTYKNRCTQRTPSKALLSNARRLYYICFFLVRTFMIWDLQEILCTHSAKELCLCCTRPPFPSLGFSLFLNTFLRRKRRSSHLQTHSFTQQQKKNSTIHPKR